jgi:signal peptidase I
MATSTKPNPSDQPTVTKEAARAELNKLKQSAAAKFIEGFRIQVIEWTVNIVILLFAWTSLVQAFVVPTGSMESTILIGDHLFVDKMAFAPYGGVMSKLLPYTDVKRGDVICFNYPLDIRNIYVKRVIGFPGDRLRIVNRDVYINGKKASEGYKQHIRDSALPYFDNFPPEDERDIPDSYIYPQGVQMVKANTKDGQFVVPPGYYFAMGDNRDNSADSRWWGLVPRENIIGKPILIWWSYASDTERLSTPLPTLDHITDLAKNFFSKTRWDRTFRLIRGQDPIGGAATETKGS